MKKYIFTLTLKPLLVVLFVLLIGQTGWSQIVSYALTTTKTAQPFPATYSAAGLGNMSSTIGCSATGAKILGNTAQATGWDSTAVSFSPKSWYTTAFSTVGWYNIKANAILSTTLTSGPKYFALQYKTSSGGTWTTVSSFTITTTPTNYEILLPSACHNLSTCYLRWIQRNANSIAGLASATSSTPVYIKTVSVVGDALSQSNTITVISVTPTTITVSFSPGNGDGHLMKMNTTNSFTAPADGYNPSINTHVYDDNLGGEQEIYNGNTATNLVVSVGSSTNVYWFRVFDYKGSGASTRHNSEESYLNPKECALETIVAIAATNVGLTTATIGANITSAGPSIYERGFFWNTSPGVTNTNNIVEGDITNGSFYNNMAGLPRGTIIYFKGYVSNESGTILSNELSFTNVPTFTNTGNYETAARWNVNEVPGTNSTNANGNDSDSPFIDGICTQTSAVICNNLTINSSKVLNINPDVSLTVNGTLTNNGGTAGLVIKSDATGTGSLIESTTGVNATVQRWMPTRLKAHYLSSPVVSATSLVYRYAWLYYWNEPTKLFVNIPPITVPITPMKGYYLRLDNFNPLLTQPPYPHAQTVTYTGALNTGNLGSSNNLTATRSPFSTMTGFNLVGNPYPSGIDWDAATGWTKVNIDNAIYVYNQTGYSTYINGVSAGVGSAQSNYIAAQQGFFVTISNNDQSVTSGTLQMTNEVRTHTGASSFRSVPDNVLSLKVENDSMNDVAVIRFSPEASIKFDSKFDAYKLFGDIEYPQLYSLTSDGRLASINSLPESNIENSKVFLNLKIGVTGKYKITASQVTSFDKSINIALEDTKTHRIQLLADNPVYSFDADTTDKENRFIVWFYKSPNSIHDGANNKPTIFCSNNRIYVDLHCISYNAAEMTITDMLGKTLDKKLITSNNQSSFETNLPSGLYIVRVLTDGTYFDKKIFIEK